MMKQGPNTSAKMLRSGLPLEGCQTTAAAMAALDSLYECCNVEIANEKAAQALFERRMREQKEYTRSFARDLFPHVEQVARHNGLWGSDGLWRHQCEIVALQVSTDWVQAHRAEQGRQAASDYQATMKPSA